MFFKTNPRQLVINKALNLFGRTTKVKVVGQRVKTGMYNVTCTINGDLSCDAAHRDWRKAYGLLVIEVEKLFTAKLEGLRNERFGANTPIWV